MLEIRPVCEHCGTDLPNGSPDAMICSFECTFCANCVHDLLKNVCPNCGGGFERRPVRPRKCITDNCLEKFPATRTRKINKVDAESLEILQSHFEKTPPQYR